MYNLVMKIITTTNARKSIGSLIDHVRDTGETLGIGRRNAVDVIVMPFPKEYRKDANDITNVNAYSRSFDFLSDEPDIYSVADVRKRHA